MADDVVNHFTTFKHPMPIGSWVTSYDVSH